MFLSKKRRCKGLETLIWQHICRTLPVICGQSCLYTVNSHLPQVQRRVPRHSLRLYRKLGLYCQVCLTYMGWDTVPLDEKWSFVAFCQEKLIFLRTQGNSPAFAVSLGRFLTALGLYSLNVIGTQMGTFLILFASIWGFYEVILNPASFLHFWVQIHLGNVATQGRKIVINISFITDDVVWGTET